LCLPIASAVKATLMQWLIGGLCLLTALLGFGALAPAVRARWMTPRARRAAAGLPPQGVFENCDPSLMPAACERRLGQMRDAGIQLVLERLPAFSSQLPAYLRAIRASGLRGIWQVSDPGLWTLSATSAFGATPAGSGLEYPQLGTWRAACSSCATNGQLLAYVARFLTPYTWGWYVADDSQVGQSGSFTAQQTYAGIRALSAALRADAPGTTTVMSAYGNGGLSQLQEGWGTADLTAQEIYPVITRTGGSGTTVAQASHGAEQDAAAVQGFAQVRGGASAFILQAFSWAGCSLDAQSMGAAPSSPYPSAAELIAMRNGVLTGARPALLLWYDFDQTVGWAPGTMPSWCTPVPDPAARLAALTAAVRAPY
jgi:hypothetical protein